MFCIYKMVDFHNDWVYTKIKGYTNVQQFWL